MAIKRPKRTKNAKIAKKAKKSVSKARKQIKNAAVSKKTQKKAHKIVKRAVSKKNKKIANTKSNAKPKVRAKRNVSQGIKTVAEAPRSTKPSKSKKAQKTTINTLINTAMSSKVMDEIISDHNFEEYVTTNIGEPTMDIVKALATPQTDDRIAEKLEMKINDVRRTLNLLNGEGIAKYVVNKNSKGWLSFKWYIDKGKLDSFRAKLAAEKNNGFGKGNENCNDFFFCEKCDGSDKTPVPFDAAFESNFRCTEGHLLKRADSEA